MGKFSLKYSVQTLHLENSLLNDLQIATNSSIMELSLQNMCATDKRMISNLKSFVQRNAQTLNTPHATHEWYAQKCWPAVAFT